MYYLTNVDLLSEISTYYWLHKQGNKKSLYMASATVACLDNKQTQKNNG